MAAIQESPFGISFGELQRIPTKFITFDTQSPSILVKSLAETFKKSQKNLTPVFVKPLEEDTYEAVDNVLVLEAAVEAGLDFVWCIPVNQDMEAQISLESGQTIQIKLNGVEEQNLIDALTFIKTTDPAFKKIDAEKLANTILSAYSPSWKNFKNLTKLKCGIGPKSAPLLAKYFIF